METKTTTFTLLKDNKELGQFDTIKECVQAIMPHNTNAHYCLNGSGGFSILKDNEKIKVDYETLRGVEEEYCSNMYDKRMSKLLDIAKGLDMEITSQSNGGSKHFDFDNCYIFCNNIKLGYSYSSKGRIEIMTIIPRTKDNEYIGNEVFGYDNDPLRITVSDTRETEKIVNDIKRKFLPKHLEYIAKANEIIEKRENYNNSVFNNMISLKGSELTKHEEREKSLYLCNSNVKCYEDEVTFNYLSCTYEQAKEIVNLLNK